MKLKDRVVVVTGGAQGIGRAIVMAIAREGARLAVADRNQVGAERVAAQAEELGATCIAVRTDVTSPDDHSRLVSEVIERFGRIDVLVNNAGIQEKKAGLLSLTQESWDKTMNVNLRGMFFLSQAVASVMASQGGGAIVNVASIAGHVFWHGILPYNVSKAGVRGLTGSMALELAPHGIRVNAVAPGYVDTDLNQESFSVANAREEAAKKIPLGRVAQPDDIPGAVVFLASNDSAYVTGHTLVVDGGYTLI